MKNKIKHLALSDKVDLCVYYDADTRMYTPEILAQHGVTEDRFIERYEHCPSVGFTSNGVHFGGVIIDGTMCHIAVLPEYQGRWAQLLPELLSWIFSVQDPVFARVDRDNQLGMRFMQKMQWECVSSDASWCIFKISSAQQPAAYWQRQPKGS